MIILQKNLIKCKKCWKLRWTIKEKYNGVVPVQCKCDFWGTKKPNPCCMCIGWEDTNNPRIIWKPCTDNIESDGQVWHNPHFAGPTVW